MDKSTSGGVSERRVSNHTAEEKDNSTVHDDDGSVMDRDALEMKKMGKAQVLRRRFNIYSTFGLSVTAMITWGGQLVIFVQGLSNGGPAGLVISFLLSWTAMAAIIASLAELLSMWPTSGGQYHWTFTLSSPKWAPFLSYICGWQTMIAWQALFTTAIYLTGNWILGMIILNNPDTFQPQMWHGTLLSYAVVALVVIINTVAARWLASVESFMLTLYVVGFVIVLVTICAMSPTRASATDVFATFFNEGGWPSQGISWWVGLQGVIIAWLGADGAIHLSEEVRNASTVLPWSLMGSIVINGLLGWAMLLVVLFFGGNLMDALSSATGFPVIEIFQYATGSAAGATGLSTILLLLFAGACIVACAASSRELWAFARDRGVPGSGWLSKVHPGLKLPLPAIFVTTIICMALNVIGVGSTAALNAVTSLTVAGFMFSYVLPIWLLLYHRIRAIRGVGKEPPWGPWRLGRWLGVFINAYALIWAFLIAIWSFFPPAVNPTPASMNWSSLVYGAVTLFSLAFWFIDGRKRYAGPVRDAAGGAIETTFVWTKT